MEKVKAVEFYNAWLKIVNKRIDELLPIWRNNKIFTSCIIGNDSSIIKEVANELDLLSYENNYYCIDTILYKTEDRTPKIEENSFWFRDLRVAFEHENNFCSGLYQEVSHLLITNCDLKVLVTYPNGEIENELEYLHEIISGNRNSNEISKDESFLLIFGYEKDFRWEGRIYGDNGWIALDTAANSRFSQLRIL